MNSGIPIAKGNTAKIYLYDNKIMKVFNDHLPITEASYEANKQYFAHKCGLSVPKVHDVTCINGKPAIIMEYVKGRTLGEMLLKNMDKAAYYMNISVDIQREIHSIVTDSPEAMSAKLNKQINSVDLLDQKRKAVLLEKLEKMTYEKRLCHGDFHMFNLMMSDNDKVTIIDWVDASAGDLRADVYRRLTGCKPPTSRI